MGALPGPRILCLRLGSAKWVVIGHPGLRLPAFEFDQRALQSRGGFGLGEKVGISTNPMFFQP